MCIKIEQEFEELFLHCQKITNSDQSEMRKILRPLRMYLLKQQLLKLLKIFLFIVSICCAVYYVDTLNWYFCAIGRILLIKMLPVWNWQHLSRSECLIPKKESASKPSGFSTETLNEVDCRACQHFDMIDVLKEATYSTIRDKFLVRGLPVIVSDTKPDFDETQKLEKFIDNISANMSGMRQEKACELETNLMMSRYASVDEVLRILTELAEFSDDLPPWFVSFRNCKLQAIKASRLMMKKPYFYPRTLQAPYTSWLLMSQNFANYTNNLKMFGLIIATQLKGSLKVDLKVKRECMSVCEDIKLELFAGESLVFLSDLWTFSYQYTAEKNFSVTFITETSFA